MNNFAAVYMYHNPLHLSTYKELIKLEKEVLDMTNALLTDPKNRKDYFGVITSGGSESLIAALYAYRCYFNRPKPNIVIPVTAHAAIDKGCFYFNIEARKARLTDTFEVDMNHVESLIDSNTIMLLGSAPNYPHGISDPIDKLAKLAKKKGIACHVDGCLGGFVGAFSKEHRGLYSLDRDGVTSVSLDHHKFALAPKGISTIFYKTRELRHHQYYINMDWKGGLYGTFSFPGSRSGFASAAAWYSMTQVTQKGYKQNAEIVSDATFEGAKRLRKVEDIQVFGRPDLCVIAFTSTNPYVSHLALTDFLKHERKWNISAIHKPNGIHVSVTLANADNVKNRLSKDVKDGM